MNGAGLALAAMLPLALGTAAHGVETMTLSLCSASGTRTIEIPVPGRKPGLPEPCAAKACHAECRRRFFDPAQ